VLVDLGHHAVGVLELVVGVLELAVEHPPVGDDHHLVEHLGVGGVVQRRQAVDQPGDGVGLARPRRVLHQVVGPRPVLPGGGLEPADGVPLMEAGEDERAVPGRLRSLARGRLLNVDESSQEVEPGVALPHLFPQVGGGVASGLGGLPAPSGRPGPAVPWLKGRKRVLLLPRRSSAVQPVTLVTCNALTWAFAFRTVHAVRLDPPRFKAWISKGLARTPFAANAMRPEGRRVARPCLTSVR
jgi:hypothetical protein